MVHAPGAIGTGARAEKYSLAETYRHRSGWPGQIKRKAIAESIPVHRIKGTYGSVKRVLKALDAGIEIHEYKKDKGPSHSGEIKIYAGNSLTPDGDTLITPLLQKQIKRVVKLTKPARSRLKLSLGVKFENSLGLAAAVASVKKSQIRVKAEPQTDIRGTSFLAGGFAPQLIISRTNLEVK